MPQYKVQIPGQGTFNIESPTELTDEQAYMAVMRDLQPKPEEPKPEAPTVGGQFKEFAKGVIPGAVGMGQTALTGISALLPEETEKSAREYIDRGAAALKAPFAAAPGYEETVGRKFGEATGSILPFLAMGPLGAAGRVGMAATGIGAGAGEARIRAEQEGATPEQRATATALGTIPGAFEMFAPMQILGRLSTPIQAGIINRVQRALVAGGEEAAQEAASQVAQNLIAKGIYKPDQAIIEQVGESAAYGGATGALVQGIMDMALGRRAKASAQPQQPGAQAQQPALDAQGQPLVPAPEAAPIAEPTIRGVEPPLEAPEDIAAGPTKAAQRKLLAEQKAFLKQYEEQAAKREAEAAEYERIKSLTPEEYALEQMAGRGKTVKNTYDAAAQEKLNAELTGLGYQDPAAAVRPEHQYALQQIGLAKDREAQPNLDTFADYLLTDPKQAAQLVASRQAIPGLPEAQGYSLRNKLEKRLTKIAQQEEAQTQEQQAAAQERARGLFEQQGEDKTSDLLAGAREQVGNTTVRPEVAALQRIGERSSPLLTANRDIEAKKSEEALIGKLVDTLPVTDRSITPGEVYLGLGTKKQDVRNLQAQLAIARLTRNRDQQNEIRRELEKTRAIPTEGGLGTEGGKTAAEFISRSKLPEARVNEAEADKHATDQRNTLLGMARMLASPTIMLAEKKAKLLSDAKEQYVAQHAAEIEARRKAFGLSPMEDWERAEARARALEGLNTLTNNWNQFEDKVISVKALQNITREAVYQNLYKAVERKASEQKDTLTSKLQAPQGQQYFFEDQEGNRIEGKTMETPRQTGPRVAGPKELTLKTTPNIAATDADAAKQFIEQVMSQVETKGRTRVEPTTTEKPASRVGDLASIAALFKQTKTGGKEVDLNEATVGLLDNLRKALRTNTDPEFVSLARETAQKIAEGNLPSEYDVRDLDEMMKAHEVAGRSETRPGATSEELQRTSAQPQKELFPEAAVQVQRATPANFQKMLDSKNIQGMRESLAQAKADNKAVLEQIKKYAPSVQKELRAAQEALNKAKAKAETLTAASTEQRQEPTWYAPAVRQVVELESVLQGVPKRLDALRDIQRSLKGLNAKDRADLVQLAEEAKKTAGAPDIVANFNDIINAAKDPASLDVEIKRLENIVKNAANMIDGAREKLDSLMTSYQQDVVLRTAIDRQAKKATADVEAATKRLRDAQTAYRKEREAEIKAETTPDELTATPKEAFKKSAQAGREGLGLEGERIERDTLALAERDHELRSKLGSLEDQLTKAKSAKKKADIQQKIDETEAEIAALPETAPVTRTRLGDKSNADIEFEKAQIANARALNESLGLTGGLPSSRRGPLEKDTRTGRTSQSGKKKAISERGTAITNALLARRGELSDINMRVEMLEKAGKPVPPKLAKEKQRAETRVAQARKAQESVAKLEKDTRAALSTSKQKEIETELRRAKQTGEEPRLARGVETTSPDLTVSQVKALEDNDIRQAMNDIAADGNTSKLNQVVAQRLAAMLDSTDVKVESSLKDKDGKSVLGMATSQLVQLNRNGGLSQEILLHEGTHAATERVIVQYEKDPTKLTEVQRVAVRELKALHAAIKNDPRITSASAKGDLSEFVAEVFSNKNLQNQLSQKKWRLSDAWKGFKSIIMRMLGVENPETMLGAALQSIDALMVPSSDRTVGGKETAVSRRLSAKDIAALHTGSNSMQQFAEQFGTTAIKQKDRTVEDANRIGQEYLDDMYANPMDYVAPAEESKLNYSTKMSDGTDLNLDDPLHYVEADAEQLVNLKAKNDPRLREREADSISRQRKKDLRELIKNMMDTPEFTYVEQALVAKAASKFAVLADKDGRLKLATIEPNNRHNVAMVTSQDAGAVIEELRAGKPLKQAFLSGMQKNSDRNAKLNESRNGWYKFDQSSDYKDGEKLSAAVAGTSWCTSGKTMATQQLRNGDFYVNYVNGKPAVAVRMDGKNKIGEVRGNTPNQALNADQLKIAEKFLRSKNFEGASIYLDELDKKVFLQAVAKGETDFGPADLIKANKAFRANGEISNYGLETFLSFSHIDGHTQLRPDPSERVKKFFTDKLYDDAKLAYKNGYYPFSDVHVSDLKKGTASVEFAGKKYDVKPDTIKALKGLTVSSYRIEDKGITLPALETVEMVDVFSGQVNLPALKTADTIRVFNETANRATIKVPASAQVRLVRPASRNAHINLRGVETVDTVQLRRNGDTLTLVAPELKYTIVDSGLVSYAENAGLRYTQALTEQVTKERGKEVADALDEFDAYWDTAVVDGEDTTAVEEATTFYNEQLLKSIKNALPRNLFKQFETDLNKKGEFVDQSPHKNIDDFSSFLFARATDEEYAAAYLKEVVQDVYPDIDVPDIGVDLLQAPNLLGERAPVEIKQGEKEQETPRYARAQATGFEDELATASELIAKPKTVREKVEANLGLAFRTQVLDRLAPLEKVANEQMDAFKGMQMMYYLRMADQKMSFVQQSVGRGVPQLVEKKRADGRVERLIESQNGPNLVNVVETLKQAPGMNAQAANQLFTLYLAAKRGDRVGYDVLNFGASEAKIKSAVAKIEANEDLRNVFEKAREQYNDYNRDLVKFLEDTGAITPEEAKRLTKTNDYIPYYREQNGNAVLVIGGEGTFKVGNLTDQPQLRQLIGGNDKILDFLTSSVQNTSMIMDMGLRNQATKNAMYELASLNMAQFLGGEPSGSDIVRFKDKGVDKFVRIETDAAGIPADLLVKGMEGMPVNNSAIVQVMGGFSTLLRRAITVSPLYSARQVFRDSVAAPLLSGADFVPVLGALKQIGKSDTRETLESRGIVGGQILTGTNEDLTRILGELQSGKMGVGQFIAKAEAIAMEADALTRRAQYDSYIAQGLSEMEATLMSLESMNFNRRGLSPSARFMSTVIPFFNAQLQSLDVLYRAMSGKMPMNERLDIQGKLLRRGALLASTSVAYALLMQDDETYKNANPDEKYNNFFVHVPGIKEAIRVPVPFEIGYIFKSLPEAIVNTMASEHGGEEAYKAFKNIAIQTVPGGTSMFLPAALKPVVEGVTNYSFYSGRSLETKSEQMQQPEYRYRDNTSEIAKQVGALTGTSPIKIENLIRGYTGSMGIALAQSLNFAMPTNGTPEQATKRLSDTPVIGPLFQPEDAGGIVGAVYDRIQTLTEVKRTYDNLVKSGQGAEAREFLQRNADDYAKSAVAGNVQQQLTKITQAANAIKASSMTPDEKRKALDGLQQLRIQIAASVRGVL